MDIEQSRYAVLNGPRPPKNCSTLKCLAVIKIRLNEQAVMTLGTITLLAITGSMLAIKLAIMILAVVLLAKALSPRRSRLALPGVSMPAAHD